MVLTERESLGTAHVVDADRTLISREMNRNRIRRRPGLWLTQAYFLAALSVTSLHAAEMRVEWRDNSSVEAGFLIERTENGASFTEVGRVSENVTSFVDTTAQSGRSYWYRVRAYNGANSSPTSNVTGASVGSGTGSGSRLVNLSARSNPGSGEQSLIIGFVVGNGTKPVLVRAIGPGLASYTSAPVSQDPNLSVQVGEKVVASNENWGGTDELKVLFQQLGAFALPSTSRDAALVSNFSAGGYTMFIRGSGTGLAMAELYDAEIIQGSGRLVNLSVRAQTGTGEGVLILGFVISGSTPMRVLIRAVGPSLAALGVNSALRDPQLQLYRGSLEWASNDDWSGNLDLNAAFEKTGAFRLPDFASKDAALIALLPPGAYTAVVSGVRGSSGIALAEVYELP
jgi:hypothetical protein